MPICCQLSVMNCALFSEPLVYDSDMHVLLNNTNNLFTIYLYSVFVIYSIELVHDTRVDRVQ